MFATTVLARRGIADTASIARFLGAPEDGLNDPHLLPDADRVVDRIRPGAGRRRAGDGVRRLRRGRPDRARPAGPRVPAPRPGHGAVRPVPGGRGPWALDGGGRRGGPRRRGADRDRGHRVDERRGDRAGGRPRDRRHHHRPPPPARGPPGGRRHRQPAASRLRLPGSGPVRVAASRSRWRGCSSATCSTRRRRRGTSRTSRRSGRCRTSRRSWARTAPSRASASSACATARGRGSRRCSSERARGTAAIDLETVGFVLAPRLNAAGRVGEAMDAARLLLAATPEEAATLAVILEEANATRKDLMRAGLAEARAAFSLPDPGQAPGQQAWLDAPASRRDRDPRRRRSGPGRDARRRSVAGRDPRPHRRSARGRDRAARHRGHGHEHPGRRRDPRVLPQRRAHGPRPRPRRVRRPVRPPRRARRGRGLRAAGRPVGRVRRTVPRGRCRRGAGGPASPAQRGSRAARTPRGLRALPGPRCASLRAAPAIRSPSWRHSA